MEPRLKIQKTSIVAAIAANCLHYLAF